jgi:crotonobetainyl-CoA:carnitine CoA-transferase CaiB-like acyl-CoA transferase
MGALAGLRILDLTHMLSGPYAALLLADLGADVVKIEPPKGEKTRTLLADDPDHSSGGMGAYFLALNRNKRSVALNLKVPADRALFLRLVAAADVVLDNFAFGVTERLGVEPSALRAANPRIVSCSITGFGGTGPRRDQVSFDMVAQAMGGGMSITGLAGGGPMRAGLPVGDLGGGMMAAVGILAALRARDTTGEPQHVDISMHDAQISLLSYMATMAELSGRSPGPMGNAHPVHVPYDTFQSSDGPFVIAVIFDGFWTELMAVVDLPELDIPEHRHQPGRHANREVILSRLRARFLERPRGAWLTALTEARIPCAPVYDLREALADPQVEARDMLLHIHDPEGQPVGVVGNPIKIDTASPKQPAGPPPTLDRDRQSVCADWLGP